MSTLSMFQELFPDDWVVLSTRIGAAIKTDDSSPLLRLLEEKFNTPETSQLVKAPIAYDNEEKNITIPAYYAIESRKHNALKAILDFTKDPENRQSSDIAHDITLLMIAAEKGNIEAIKMLLDYGADINVCCEDKNGFVISPLFVAIFNGFQKTAELLVSKGAVFSISEALVSVEDEQRFTSFIKELISKNPSLLTAKGSPGNRTLLHHASGHGNLTIVKWLLNNGADINATDDDNQTPLYYSKAENNETISKYLISNGAIDGGSTNQHVIESTKQEITSIVERLEVMEGKLGIELSSIYASIEKNSWEPLPDYEAKVQFDVMNGGDSELQDSIRIKAVAYNEAGESIGQDDVIILKDDFLGYDSKVITFSVDQTPARIRLFPVKL